eukprot:Plantae.Rhodophyta-Purpureofilum_apyrenoidigerum.ctg8333.p1 GENE.Plantae.Rhodophyta-Purpureofilum_apyrenoidigerum.ctg8333~~Plantae.Rhodophyta-Purpureofilum_apyrenoidigerum.ctg8333.p1  ORF type:complete len:343 (+),score=54.93 Plantae.Rhodophyta-Purpureofilum_apyrenoidigerum.ctg8333:130-1158(+)
MPETGVHILCACVMEWRGPRGHCAFAVTTIAKRRGSRERGKAVASNMSPMELATGDKTVSLQVVGTPPPNFRDAADACPKIRPNVLFRSAFPYSVDHLNYLKNFSFVDLRSKAERVSFRDPKDSKIGDGIGVQRLTGRGTWIVEKRGDRVWYKASLFEESWFISAMIGRFGPMKMLPVLTSYLLLDKTRARQIGGQLMNDLGLEGLLELIMEQSILRMPSVLRTMTAQRNLPSVTFCSAGKDRTGLIWAMLLATLGASSDEIAADFSRSSHLLQSDETYYGDICRKFEEAGVNVDEFMSSPGERILDLLHRTEKRYGSIAKFLEQAGFSAEEQLSLERRFRI